MFLELNANLIADAYALVEHLDLRVKALYLHPNQLEHLKRNSSTEMSFELSRGVLWGADVNPVSSASEDLVYLLPDMYPESSSSLNVLSKCYQIGLEYNNILYTPPKEYTPQSRYSRTPLL